MANATIKDVAREAGVSIATVSRVLNKSSTVREDLADRVNSAIEKLGYYPNSIARTLKNDSSKTVGFVVSDIANDFFTSMVPVSYTHLFICIFLFFLHKKFIL